MEYVVIKTLAGFELNQTVTQKELIALGVNDFTRDAWIQDGYLEAKKDSGKIN
jgi:hypothetical protein